MVNRKKYKINPLDLAKNKAIGILLPFGTDKTFLKLSYTTEEQAVTNLKNLLLTIKGERPFQPDFGTDIMNILFDQNQSDILRKLKESVESDINYWLPYIIIDDIDISSENNTVNFFISFKVTENGSNQTVSVTVTENGIMNIV